MITVQWLRFNMDFCQHEQSAHVAHAHKTHICVIISYTTNVLSPTETFIYNVRCGLNIRHPIILAAGMEFFQWYKNFNIL